jgi:gamma-glutamyltranspeptidase/glutathione hydrolase
LRRSPVRPDFYGLIQGEADACRRTQAATLLDGPDDRPAGIGQLQFAVGSPGGPTIINTVTQIILNIIDFGMNIQQAIDWPRLHHSVDAG